MMAVFTTPLEGSSTKRAMTRLAVITMGPDTYQEASLKLPKIKLTRMEDIIREVLKGGFNKGG